MAEAPEVHAEEDGGAIPEVHGEDEIVTKFLHRLVCQLCNNIFEKDIPIACVHFTFCRKCLEKNSLPADLGDAMGMVCTPCSKISVSGLDPSQLHTLSLMQSNAIKSRRALQENHGQPDVNLLSQHLSAVNIRDSEGFPDSSLPPAEQPPPVSVPDGINSSDSSQSESRSDSPHGSTSSRTSSLPGSSQPIKGGTTRCTPEPEPGCQPSPGKKSPGKKSPGKSPGKKGRPCETCDLVKDVSTVTCHNGDTVNVQGNFTCLSTHVIYYIYCELCNEGYVGRTSDPLRKRMSEHRSAILNKKNGSVANHFNLEVPKHTVKDHFRVSVIQSFPVGYDGSREEDDMIDRLGTIKHGINKNQAQQK